MSIVTTLLNAQRRSPEEASRLTAAVNAALDIPERNPNASADEVIDAAAEAYRLTNREIADEKNPPAAAPEGHHDRFVDDPATDGSDFSDEEPVEVPQTRTDAYYQLTPATGTPADGGGPPWNTPAEAAVAGTTGPSPAATRAGENPDMWDTGADSAPEEQDETMTEPATALRGESAGGIAPEPEDDENFDDSGDEYAGEYGDTQGDNGGLTDTADNADESADEEDDGWDDEEPGPDPAAGGDVTSPFAAHAENAQKAPVSGDPPSVLDKYDGVGPAWDDAIELEPNRPPIPDPAAAVSSAAKTDPAIATSRNPAAPSQRATRPPDNFKRPNSDPEPSFAERIRESAGAMLSRFGGGDGDPRKKKMMLAGAAAAVLVGGAAVFSLSGGRGDAPVPAGVAVAPPPAQTENPDAEPSTGALAPATVSGKCVGDSDAVAPFAGEKSRAWVCGRANGLDGAVLNITFNKPVVITAITVVPGFNYVAPDGSDEWDRHRLVTGVTWRMGGKSFPQTINPTRTGVTTKFPSVITQEMSLTITSSTRPAKTAAVPGIGAAGTDADAVDDTTAISSIVITGHPVDPAS